MCSKDCRWGLRELGLHGQLSFFRLLHSLFNFLGSVGNSGSEEFGAVLGDQKHVLEVKGLAVHGGDGLEGNGGIRAQRSRRISRD